MLRVLLITTLALSLGCSEDESPQANADNTTTASSNEGFTLPTIDCPETDFDLQCPELPRALPTPPTSPTAPTPPLLEDGTDFSHWELPTCSAGMMPIFGKQACIAVGTPCPTGDWPENLPASNVKFVTPGGTGDGSSPQSAMGSIQAAVNGSVWGGTVVLSKGVFIETISMGRGTQLIGTCARHTVIDSSTIMENIEATIQITGDGGTSVQDVTVTGRRRGVAIWDTLQEVSLQGILLDNNKTVGFFASGEGTTVTAQDIVIQNTQSKDVYGGGGQGIGIQSGATLTIERAVIDNSTNVGLYASDNDTTVMAQDIVIKNTQSDEADETGGEGTHIVRGATFTMKRAIIDNNRMAGILAKDSLTKVTAEDIVIQNTHSRESDREFGRGINVQGGPTLIITRVMMDKNRDVGLFAAGVGTTVEAEDLLIQNTQNQESDQTSGRGLSIQQGATLTIERAVMDNNKDVGFNASGNGTIVGAHDIVIQNTQCQESDKTSGKGLSVHEGAKLTIERAVIDNNRVAGILANDDRTTVTVEDIVIQNTQSHKSNGTGGLGTSVQEGATLIMKRAVMNNNRDVGLYASGTETAIEVQDIVIQNTQSQESDETSGSGMAIWNGATLTIERAVMANNRNVSLLASGTETAIEVLDIVIQNTQSQESDKASGIGINVQHGATLTIERAVMDNNRGAGLFARGDGSIVRAQDIVIQNTRGEEIDGTNGAGIQAQHRAALSLTRTILDNNRSAGLVVLDATTTIAAQDIIIQNTQIHTCATPGFSPSCEEGYGDGLLVMGGGDITLNSFVSRGNARVGVYLFDATGSLFDNVSMNSITGSPTFSSNGQGSITGNKVGLNLIGTEEAVSTWLDNFGATICADNHGTVDGCYDVFQELPLPGPYEAFSETIDTID